MPFLFQEICYVWREENEWDDDDDDDDDDGDNDDVDEYDSILGGTSVQSVWMT